MRSAIYTVNSTSSTVADGGAIPLGATVRRFGQNLIQNGNSITLMGCGYYSIDATVTVTPAAAGNAIVTLQKDGVAIVSVTVTADGTSAVTIPVIAMVRHQSCANANISLILTDGAGIITGVTALVEKV